MSSTSGGRDLARAKMIAQHTRPPGSSGTPEPPRERTSGAKRRRWAGLSTPASLPNYHVRYHQRA